jgi:hypothetical protein
VYLDQETLTVSIAKETIAKYEKDFARLPNSGDRDAVLLLRKSITKVTDLLLESPELLHNKEYFEDLQKVLAMRAAMNNLGIFHDA